jgi:hypothetical protein
MWKPTLGYGTCSLCFVLGEGKGTDVSYVSSHFTFEDNMKYIQYTLLLLLLLVEHEYMNFLLHHRRFEMFKTLNPNKERTTTHKT